MTIRDTLRRLDLPASVAALDSVPSAPAVQSPYASLGVEQAERGLAAQKQLGGSGLSSVAARLNLLPPMPPHPSEQVSSVSPAESERARDPSVVHVITKPSYQTSTTARFVVPEPNGRELRPGERWLIELPPEFRGAAIRTVILGHRKDEKFRGTISARGWDTEGAYNLVEARDNQSGEWLVWRDRYGAKKFAEPRDDIEHENLYDWPTVVGMRTTDLLSVTGVGKGDNAVANVFFVEVEVFPPGEIAALQKEIFTPGTRFVTRDNPKPGFGGGHNCRRSPEQLDEEGLYPNALAFPTTAQKVSEQSYVDADGAYRIKLTPGQIFGGFEISIGDTVLDRQKPAAEQRNRDGHYGEIGHAKMNVSYARPGQPEELFMRNFGIPPSGVLSGGPDKAGQVTQPGDELVLRFTDAAFVMGYQVQFMKPGSLP